MSKLVTVFGGARVATDSKLYADSLVLGRLLAEAGYTVATGGYFGTMEAVLQGAAQAGGHTIGYTCSIFDNGFRPNPWVREERKTDSLTARIGRIAEESDAFIVVHGGLGTLAELAVVWNVMLIDRSRSRPLVVVGPEWPRVLAVVLAETQLGSSAMNMLTLVEGPEEVIAALKNA